MDGVWLISINRFVARCVNSCNMTTDADKSGQARGDEYGPEVLCASWNPLAAALAEPMAACRELAAELAAVDAEAFLASFYRSQQG